MTPPPSSAADAVHVSNLRRTYRPARKKGRGAQETVALDDVSLRVPVGEVHGLLGPNGAGKTTLCRILCTVLLPTSGTATVLGHDVVSAAEHVRSLVGVVFGGEKGLYLRLSPRRNLMYWAALYRIPWDRARAEADRLLARVDLADRADDPAESLSRGMKQRLHLARGLIGDPRLLLLDEPTSGLDPVAAHDFRGLIDELRAEGRTVLLSTHDMSEAEAVCDRVSFIDRGVVLATERPQALSTRAAPHTWIEAEDPGSAGPGPLSGMAGVVEVARQGGVLRVKVATTAAEQVVRRLMALGCRGVHVLPPRLEDLYLDLIGSRRAGD